LVLPSAALLLRDNLPGMMAKRPAQDKPKGLLALGRIRRINGVRPALTNP